jgi:hypothetical protein
MLIFTFFDNFFFQGSRTGKGIFSLLKVETLEWTTKLRRLPIFGIALRLAFLLF